jgi:hypothetical protein
MRVRNSQAAGQRGQADRPPDSTAAHGRCSGGTDPDFTPRDQPPMRWLS